MKKRTARKKRGLRGGWGDNVPKPSSPRAPAPQAVFTAKQRLVKLDCETVGWAKCKSLTSAECEQAVRAGCAAAAKRAAQEGLSGCRTKARRR